ncbi:alcohol dehydrogenase [Lachnellula suecica]|uniref:Alcohol dehydrogenase n=1 Tax=Lachnellula suecica TaxID=602035 RepID=A0A8T9CEI4_9HELO|nr:alcohol dehydrogenase [Lachnellula suecica]
MASETLETKFVIPKTYKAAVYDEPGKISIKIVELETPEPGPGEVLIRLTVSHQLAPKHTTYPTNCGCSIQGTDIRKRTDSDLSLMTNSWTTLPFPTPPQQIGGHEGVGVIHKLGPGNENSPVKLGERVGVKWAVDACGGCRQCRKGSDGHCSVVRKISGYFTPGTFAEYVVSSATYVTPIPEHLDSAAAAPMLCAGLTSYSALRKSNAQSGDWVVISGAGGGLGHLAVQIAGRGMAFRVIGLDHISKKSLVLENCGAEAFIDIANPGIAAEIKRITDGEGAAAVVVCAGSNQAYAQALGMLGFGGTMVCVGMPDGKLVEIGGAYPMSIATSQARIVGSSIGSRGEAVEVLQLAARGLVKTHFRTERLEGLEGVFGEMKEGKLVGRVVLDLT